MNFDRDFEGLLVEYRNAAEAPEPGMNFMPRLWQRIEARRSVTFRFRRVSRVFVGAAAVLCLFLAGVGAVLPSHEEPAVRGTYLDALADATPPLSLAPQGIVREPSDTQ